MLVYLWTFTTPGSAERWMDGGRGYVTFHDFDNDVEKR